jgi:DHA2 family methylenomycin A resistance protein-like MFS transporter
MVIIDVTIVNVALPSLGHALGGQITWLQWVVDGYTLTFAGFLLSAGHLGDEVGAKRMFLCGLALFVLTSIGCGLATSFEILTAFRLLQGVASALLVPSSLALINAAYDNQAARAKAIGVWAGIGGIAGASGPILGAVLTTYFSWRAVFFVNVPIGLIGFVLAQKYVLSPRKKTRQPFDVAGQITAMLCIAALAFGLIEAGRLGWTSYVVLTGFGISLISFILFLMVEKRVTAPMLPLTLFHSKVFSTAIVVGMVITLGIYGQLFVLTLYFQQIRDYSVLWTGFAFIPLVGVIAYASYLGGKITSRWGPRWPMVAGLAIGAIGLFAMCIANQHIAYAALILPMAAMGFGIALVVPAVTAVTIHAAPEGKAGIAAGTLNASRQVGSLLGIAIFGTIIATSQDFIVGMHVTLIIGACGFLLGFILTSRYIK